MKRYVEYMDGVEVSDTLHRRLLELDALAQRPAAWKKYGAAAAALVLVCGLGAWGLGHGQGWDALLANFRPGGEMVEIITDDPLERPDIALLDPGEVIQPDKSTLPGYEVWDGETVTYYVLPRIIYGDTNAEAADQRVALDWALGSGYTQEYLGQEEVAALMGGADALSTHLDWDDYELSGWLYRRADGSMGLVMLYGYAGPLDHFEFSVMKDQLPPTCIAYAESIEQELFLGVTVVADGHDSVASEQGGVDASSRRVSFMLDGYGYRFDLTGVSRALTEERVSRLVRRVVSEGLALDALE